MDEKVLDNIIDSANRIDKLEKRIDILNEFLIVLTDTVKILACSMYSGEPDVSAEEILMRANKIVHNWED